MLLFVIWVKYSGTTHCTYTKPIAIRYIFIYMCIHNHNTSYTVTRYRDGLDLAWYMYIYIYNSMINSTAGCGLCGYVWGRGRAARDHRSFYPFFWWLMWQVILIGSSKVSLLSYRRFNLMPERCNCFCRVNPNCNYICIRVYCACACVSVELALASRPVHWRL